MEKNFPRTIVFKHFKSDSSYKKALQYFSDIGSAKFLKKWYEIHNEIGDLQASGLKPRRVISLLVTYDPSSIPVRKFMK